MTLKEKKNLFIMLRMNLNLCILNKLKVMVDTKSFSLDTKLFMIMVILVDTKLLMVMVILVDTKLFMVMVM